MTKLDIGSPPASGFDVTPTAEEVDFFRENGYLVVEELTTLEELEWLRVLYEHIFDPANADDPGSPVDRTNGEGENGPANLSQAFFPEIHYPQLMHTTYRRNAHKYAAALLGAPAEEVTSWSHMIRKMPGGRSAPWHQDEAYWEPELSYRALGCWLPLQDVTREMGAMQFIPGSHKWGIQQHEHLQNDPKLHVLYVDTDTSKAVVCPLKAGGATFHHSRTLHFTEPNQTDTVRLAYPTEFEVKPTFLDQPNHWSWVDANRAAAGRKPPTHYLADGKMVAI